VLVSAADFSLAEIDPAVKEETTLPPLRPLRRLAAAVNAAAQRKTSPQSAGVIPVRSRAAHSPSAAVQSMPSRNCSFSPASVKLWLSNKIVSCMFSLSVPKGQPHYEFSQIDSTLDASANSFAKPEILVIAARSSWRSISLSYSTVTSEPLIISSA